MFFSIIIPVYNTEEYIEQCMDSVINQLESDYEVIIVDDGSPDKAGVICDWYASKDPERIHVIHQANKGLLMARREGIKHSKGKYIMHLDSDDYLRENALNVIKKVLMDSRADMLFFRSSRQEDFSVPLIEFPFKNGEVFSGSGKNNLYKLMCEGTKLNNMCLKVTMRDVVDIDRDYSDYKHVNIGEDLLQCLPLVDAAERIVYCEEILYYYRQNMQSITNTYNDRYYSSIRSVLQMNVQYAKKWDLGDKILINLAYGKAKYYCMSAAIHVITSSLGWDQRKKKLIEISSDPFFIEAYHGFRGQLNYKRELLAYLIIHKAFKLIYIYTKILMKSVK